MAIFSLYPHTAEKARKLSRVSFIKTLIPFTRAPPKSSSKAPPPITSHLELSFNMWILREHKHSVCSTYLLEEKGVQISLQTDLKVSDSRKLNIKDWGKKKGVPGKKKTGTLI